MEIDKETRQQVYTREVNQVAVEFNEFFVSVGAKVSEASKALIATHELSPPNDFTSQQYIPDAEKFNFRAVSSYEIRRTIMSFSSNKATGFDKVNMSVIKDALPCILPVLPSVFPAAWKISEVIPLPKDGDHGIPNNNRPISLLPAVSKICEGVALIN